ncbi:FAD-dependent oxidoreductase [Patescibacteria group bacterium]|nr:FAD-dependent oxidoreductase [Patescibacteria group bacterium]
MKTDILIIGGGPSGIVAATTARKNYPSKQIILIRKEKQAVIPCGIPYIFYRLNSVEQNLMSDQSLSDNKINLVIGEVIEIKPREKKIIIKNGDILSYDKLILALGSEPQLIPIPGIEKRGIWLVKKDFEYLKKFRQKVLKSKKVVIIGGGFIGVEFAEELSSIKRLDISIIEKLDHCLITNFNKDFAIAAEEKLKNKGVKLFTKRTVREIGGNKEAEYVELDNGEKLPADIIILSIGAQPNIDLAKKAGIKTEEKGGIWVDEYLRTNISDVFAIGDCAQTKDFISGRNILIMLASVATTEARIVANNLYQIELVRENKGTIGVFSTYIDGLALGAVGLTEKRAKKEKIDYLIGEAEASNHHPTSLPGAEKIKVKLIFSKTSEGLLLGGEIIGPESIGEMLNILSLAIQQKVSLFDFNTWQIATHPLLTSAPTVYPIITAAQDALVKFKNTFNRSKV